MSAPQNSYSNLSSAVGLGLIGFNENDVVVDYGCMFYDSFVYASRLCNKIAGIVPSSERLRILHERLMEEDVKNYDLVDANYNEHCLKEEYDCVIVNSFIEQILIELRCDKSIFYEKKISPEKKDNSQGKTKVQFLKTVYNGLKPGGKLYLSYANKMRVNIFLVLLS